MPQTPPTLDRVIRKVAVAPVQLGPAERLVAIDTRTRAAVVRRGLLGAATRMLGLGPHTTLYIVANSTEPLHAQIVDFADLGFADLEHTVRMSVRLHLHCPEGREEQAATALFDAARSPVAMLEQLTQGAITTAVGGGLAGFVQEYFRNRTGLQDTLARALTQKTGLAVRVGLTLGGEAEAMAQVIVDEPAFRLLTSDYNIEQEIALTAKLDVDERQRGRAFLHASRNGDLATIVPQAVARYFRAHVSMQGLPTIGRGETIVRLSAFLDQALLAAGRRVTSLVIEPPAPHVGARQSLQHDVPVECRVHVLEDTLITVNNRVSLELADLARYNAARSPELIEWLESTLNRVVPTLLFSATYVDLILAFDPYELRIKEALGAEAAAIGYRVQHLITVPNLQPIRLRERFPAEVNEGFELRLFSKPVQLHIVATVRIPDLRKVEPLLNRQEDIPKLIRETISKETRSFLQSVTPDRFYTRFEHSSEPGELPVEVELKQRIKERLSADPLYADVLDVLIRDVNSAIIARLASLREQLHHFDFLVEPFQSLPIRFSGNVQVMAVEQDGWERFQLSSHTLAQMTDEFVRYIVAHLEALPAEDLLYRDHSSRLDLEHVVATLATRYMKHTFGLSIRMTSVKRHHTAEETAALDTTRLRLRASMDVTEADVQSRTNIRIAQSQSAEAQAFRLLKAETELIAVEGTKAERDALLQTLDEVTKKLPTTAIAPIEPQKSPKKRAPAGDRASRLRSLLDESMGDPPPRDGSGGGNEDDR